MTFARRLAPRSALNNYLSLGRRRGLLIAIDVLQVKVSLNFELVLAFYQTRSGPSIFLSKIKLMKSTLKYLTITLLAFLAVFTSAAVAEKPNVIYILADDLGIGDLGCYGQKKLKTPNIDRIATEGMQFSDHYSGNTVCSPSRACLLTGQHPGHVHCRGNGNEPRFALDPEMTTLPRLFKNAGYATGAFGKWGLGITSAGGNEDPLTHGFDHYSGYPTSIVRDSQEIPLDEGTYIHDLIMTDAMSFIEKSVAADKPFFCYIPTAVPHAAMHAPAAMHEKWKKVYPEFNNRIGKYRAGPGETCPEVKNPVAGYAAMMENLDNQVGQILDLLKKLNVDDNTLILFASDNGAHREGGHKPDFWDSNGPFRGIKRDLYEGGIRSPFMARWPSKVKAGSKSGHISAFWDMLPTMAELTGQKIPGQSDGVSLLPTLTGGGEQAKHDFIYHEFIRGAKSYTARSLRQGEWKVVQQKSGSKKPITKDHQPAIELYNLKDDPQEKSDLAKQHPKIVSKLTELMDKAHTPLKDAHAKKKKVEKKTK